MKIFDRFRSAESPRDGRYGPNSHQVEQLIGVLRVLKKDEIMNLALVRGLCQGEVPGADPEDAAFCKATWRVLTKLPLAAIDRRDRPAPLAVRAGAEAVLTAIHATGLEPPKQITDLASSGGADLALLMVLQPEADPSHFDALWGRYAQELPALRALGSSILGSSAVS